MLKSMCLKLIIFLLSFFILPLDATLYLRDHLRQAEKGDYVVTAQGKNITLLHVVDHRQGEMIIEEITIPERSVPANWRDWVSSGASNNTSWLIYALDDQSGTMRDFYSMTQQCWLEAASKENLFTKMLSVPFEKVPNNRRKRRGAITASNPNPWWQPKMVFEGREISPITFDAWWTRWPNDGSDLAGREITIYLLQEGERYPNYFPYWLQAKGSLTKGQLRVIDSGKGLTSPSAQQFFQLRTHKNG